MGYEEFLNQLKCSDWKVLDKSFAHKKYGDWEIAFIRRGGRLHYSGSIAFVVCVRHVLLRNINGIHGDVMKEPHSYPFKLTMQEIENADFLYTSKLLNYEVSRLSINSDWSMMFEYLNSKMPNWLKSLSKDALLQQIKEYGQMGYIEKVWIEDLSGQNVLA